MSVDGYGDIGRSSVGEVHGGEQVHAIGRGGEKFRGPIFDSRTDYAGATKRSTVSLSGGQLSFSEEALYSDFCQKEKKLVNEMDASFKRIGSLVKLLREGGHSSSSIFGRTFEYGFPEDASKILGEIEIVTKRLKSLCSYERELISEMKTKFSRSKSHSDHIGRLSYNFEKKDRERYSKYEALRGKIELAKRKMFDTTDSTHIDDYDDEDVRVETREEKELKEIIGTDLAKYKAAVWDKNFAAAEILKSQLIDDYNLISEKYEKHAIELDKDALSAEIAANQSVAYGNIQSWNSCAIQLRDASAEYVRKSGSAKFEADKLEKLDIRAQNQGATATHITVKRTTPRIIVVSKEASANIQSPIRGKTTATVASGRPISSVVSTRVPSKTEISKIAVPRIMVVGHEANASRSPAHAAAAKKAPGISRKGIGSHGGKGAGSGKWTENRGGDTTGWKENRPNTWQENLRDE
ncbi:MAG: hypothetical protein LBB18_00170 [Puniceicoccales bacterium]|nr:hypothetical protein [Puniceicoccales bacterium]